MHVPSGASSTIELLPFDTALALSGKSGGYDPGKWLYVPDHSADYRYILGTRGENPLICIGINPSTAAPDALDNTLKSVQRIAEGNGYDSFIMFNVYAQRATEPDLMEKECNLFLHGENMKAFEYILSLCDDSPSVWAAWGTIIEKRDYLKDCVRDMADIGCKYGAKWVKAGKVSKKGHPHHPLYLSKCTQVEEFEIEGYLRGL